MHAPIKDRDIVRCPGCGEQRLIEWDLALRRWVCAVCDRQWGAPSPLVFEKTR